MSLQTEDGRLVVVSGATRSGKTFYTVDKVIKKRRVIVWDPEDQWSELKGFTRITSKANLLAAIQTRGNARLAFVPSGDFKEAFNFWSGCVYHWGRYYGGCYAVAEELADVSSPGKAPDNWGKLLRRGLKRSIWIFAISQRWAEADKTAFGNASEFVCFRMPSVMDIEYIAKRTRLKADSLEALETYEYLLYDVVSKTETRGKTEK